MRWSIRIARIGGIEVKLHLTFLLLLAWIATAYYLQGGFSAALEGTLFIVLLFGCVLLHEFGHAIAARAYGIKVPDITLLPIGGVARLQRMPDHPVHELVVAIAGPAVNVVIAAALFLFIGLDTNVADLEQLPSPKPGLATKLAVVNVWLVLFNLLPAFPMDGGRILRAGLAMRMSYSRATNIAASIGQGMAFLFGFLGLFTNPFLIFIALFVYLGASQEAAAAQMKEISTGLPVSEAMVTHLVKLDEADTLNDAVEALLRTSQHEFPVVDDQGTILGVLTQDDLIPALRSHGPGHSVTQVMHRNLPQVGELDPFDAAFRLMQECGCPALPVVDEDGRFVGLITPENIGELMMVRSVLPNSRLPSWKETQPTS